MLCAVGLAAGGVIPVDCAAYDTVWRYLMPLAAACFLLETDVQRLASDGGPVLTAFALGAVGMVLGALAGVALLRDQLGPVGAKLAACLCASYVGGSVNFAAVALALQLPASAMPAAMAADNLMMAAFLAVLMAVPVQRAAAAAAAGADAGASGGSPMTNKSPALQHADSPAVQVEPAGACAPPPPPTPTRHLLPPLSPSAPSSSSPPSLPPAVTAESLSLTLAAAAVACGVSQQLAAALDAAPLALLFMAIMAAGISAAAQWLRARLAGRGAKGGQQGPVFAGAAQVGTALMMLFFAVIGASAGSLRCLAGAGVLLPFLAVMVGIHWAVVALLGERLLRLPREALLLGSNANIGGSATAAAMAAARGWQPLVQPAMLAGSMGYAVGTAAGLTVARLVGA